MQKLVSVLDYPYLHLFNPTNVCYAKQTIFMALNQIHDNVTETNKMNKANQNAYLPRARILSEVSEILDEPIVDFIQRQLSVR